MTDTNPPLTRLLSIITYIETLVLLGAGSGLFFLPDLTREQWPWQLTPFNTRFLGAVYLASMLSVALATKRWFPARSVLRVILVFTAIVLVVSLFYNDRFESGKWGTWWWFGLYVVLPVSSAYHLWLFRSQPSPSTTVSVVWQRLLIGAGIIIGSYGLGLLAAPTAFSSFWPWELDNFHGQLYSATFISGAVGLFTVARSAHRSEFVAAGLTQAGLGIGAIAGALMVDAEASRIIWHESWLALFIFLTAVGVAMLYAASNWEKMTQ